MPAIILGKNLLSDEELIEFAFSELNHQGHVLHRLKRTASEAAIQSSLALIKLIKQTRSTAPTAAKKSSLSNDDALR